MVFGARQQLSSAPQNRLRRASSRVDPLGRWCKFKTGQKQGYPLFGPFLTLIGKNGVNKGALSGVTVGDHMPYLCHQSHSHALLRPYYGQMGLG